MSMKTLMNRIQYAGGDSLGRINKQKLKSFQSALKNDYNSRLIKTPKKVAYYALINNNAAGLKTDYDRKYISVDFSSELQPGDVFEILDDHTKWMIYLPILTETAYLRAEIIRCRYTITIDDEEYWIYFQGPTETDLRWYIKQGINFNELNLSGTIYIKNTPKTKEFFKRFTKLKLDGHMWEVQVTDSISVPGIIELEIQEYYDNTPLELPVIRRAENAISNCIIGTEEVKQNTIVGYEIEPEFYNPTDKWKVYGNDRVELHRIIDNGRMCEVRIYDGAIRNFYVQYGDNEPLEVWIDIIEPYIKGPQLVYPYDVHTYWTENAADILTFTSDSDLVKVKQLTNNSCEVTIKTGKTGKFVLQAIGEEQEYELEVTIGSF